MTVAVENWSVSKPVNSITVRFIICVTFTELLSATAKNTWHYHHFPWFSMTFGIFHDFPGLENGIPKFHDFPWPRGTLQDFSLSRTRPHPLSSVIRRRVHSVTQTSWKIRPTRRRWRFTIITSTDQRIYLSVKPQTAGSLLTKHNNTTTILQCSRIVAMSPEWRSITLLLNWQVKGP